MTERGRNGFQNLKTNPEIPVQSTTSVLGPRRELEKNLRIELTCGFYVLKHANFSLTIPFLTRARLSILFYHSFVLSLETNIPMLLGGSVRSRDV